METAIALPNTTQFETKAIAALELAKAMMVTNVEEYERGLRFFKDLKAHQKELDITFDASIKKAHEAHKEMVAAKKRHALPIEQAEAIIEQKCGVWKRNEESRLEKERLEREATARRQAEDDALARAAEAEKAGDKTEAEEIINTPVFVPPVAAKQAAPKIGGVSTTKYYSATVTDLKSLLKAIIEGKVPMQAVKADDVFLNGQARLVKREGPLYPGVVVTSREGFGSR
jgi:hypothetical protein